MGSCSDWGPWGWGKSGTAVWGIVSGMAENCASWSKLAAAQIGAVGLVAWLDCSSHSGRPKVPHSCRKLAQTGERYGRRWEMKYRPIKGVGWRCRVVVRGWWVGKRTSFEFELN